MKTWKKKLTNSSTHRFFEDSGKKDLRKHGTPAWNRWILSRASLIWTSMRDSKEVKVHFWRPRSSPIDARACFTKISSFRSRNPRNSPIFLLEYLYHPNLAKELGRSNPWKLQWALPPVLQSSVSSKTGIRPTWDFGKGSTKVWTKYFFDSTSTPKLPGLLLEFGCG